MVVSCFSLALPYFGEFCILSRGREDAEPSRGFGFRARVPNQGQHATARRTGFGIHSVKVTVIMGTERVQRPESP